MSILEFKNESYDWVSVRVRWDTGSVKGDKNETLAQDSWGERIDTATPETSFAWKADNGGISDVEFATYCASVPTDLKLVFGNPSFGKVPVAAG